MTVPFFMVWDSCCWSCSLYASIVSFCFFCFFVVDVYSRRVNAVEGSSMSDWSEASVSSSYKLPL